MDIRGFKNEPGTSDWHPISVDKVGDEYALKVSVVSDTSGGGGGGGSSASGAAEHHNGTANTTPAVVNFSAATKHIQIENRSTDKIFVSFDNGANTRTIDSGITLDVDAIATSIEISSDVNGSAYEILALV